MAKRFRKPQAIRSELLDAAICYGRQPTGEHAECIIKLTVELDDQIQRSNRYTVTHHAVKQFMLRSKCKEEESAKVTLLNMMVNSEEMEVIEQYRAIQLINHYFKDAEYFRYGDWLLVVCGNSIVTCHKASAKRWRKVNGDQIAKAL